MALKIKLWGVRGSLPAPALIDQQIEKLHAILNQYEKIRTKKNAQPTDFLATFNVPQIAGYGGHTSCIEVSTVQQRLIIDGGSGIRCLSEKIMKEHLSLGRAQIHILMTHFHWDHLIGLPFFTPLFIPGNEVHFYAVQDELEENIRRVFRKPNFPVEFNQLASKIFFHKLEPRKSVEFNDITVTPYQLDHPDPCWGYRFEHEGKVFSHCVDSECTRVSREQLNADLPLYQNVDLMTFDAQYTFIEAAEKINWGHSSGPIGIDLALREKIKRILFIHHDPAATDSKIAEAEIQTREYYEAAIKEAKVRDKNAHEVTWSFAHESMEIIL